MVAFLEARAAGLYSSGHWLRNVIAGIIVGVVALPLAMAFAIASGARPEQGIYTAIIAGGLVSVLGGSRVQIAGPTGAFVVILSGITAQYGIAGLQVATLMAGVILLLLGLARMGAVIKFIPVPVIAGFTAGIGVIIFVGQWEHFLGLPAPSGQHFHEKLMDLLRLIPESSANTLLIAALSLAIVLGSPHVKGLRGIPAPLTALVVAAALQSLLQLPGVHTIGSAFGGIPQGLPPFKAPELSFAQVVSLIGPAFTIAMLGAIESLLSAVVADGMAGTRHDSNQELVGQGIANIAVPLFGGFAATGAIARTATNVRNGGTSPIAGITHALTLVAVLVFLAPLAARIPLATLAAILFVVAWNMSEVRHFGYILRKAPGADRIILVITFLLTVFADLVVAVNVGVILAILHFLRRMSETVDTLPADGPDLARELSELGIAALPPQMRIFEINGPVFFGAAEHFERALMPAKDPLETLIIRLRRVPFMDITGIRAIEEVIANLRRRGMRVVLCEANARVHAKLNTAGVVAKLPAGDYCGTLAEALARAGLHKP